MNFNIEFELEEDGRWIAEIDSLPGVMAYGSSKEEATCRVRALAAHLQLDASSANTGTRC